MAFRFSYAFWFLFITSINGPGAYLSCWNFDLWIQSCSALCWSYGFPFPCLENKGLDPPDLAVALWSRITRNTDWSTGPLARPFVYLRRSLICLLCLACFTHTLCYAHSLTLLTPSLMGNWLLGWLFFLCFSLFWTIVRRHFCFNLFRLNFGHNNSACFGFCFDQQWLGLFLPIKNRFFFLPRFCKRKKKKKRIFPNYFASLTRVFNTGRENNVCFLEHVQTSRVSKRRPFAICSGWVAMETLMAWHFHYNYKGGMGRTE